MDQDSFWQAVTLVGGFAMFCLGASYFWKFIQAAMYGRVVYWSGLEKFGFLFAPIGLWYSPLICHLPYNPAKSLIKERQTLWVHLVFGPVFLILSLMFMTSGADLMHLPGSSSLNTVLTLGRSDVPACIIYTPPFNYKFPFVKKAAKIILRFLVTVVPENKKDIINPFEQNGTDLKKFTKTGIPFIDDDDDDDKGAATAPTPAPAPTTTTTTTTHSSGGHSKKKH